MNARLKWAAIVVLAAALVGALFLYRHRETRTVDDLLHYTDGDLLRIVPRYEGDRVLVEIRAADTVPDSAQIRYTLDASVPDKASPRYTEPLSFPAGDWSSLPVVRAAVFYRGGTSPCYTKVIPAEENAELPEGMELVFITTDPDNLYGYERGIMIEGKTKDDYINGGGDYDALPSWAKPANFMNRGESWIRDAHVTFLDQHGTLLGEQDVGLSVSGNASAYLPVKSLRLTAKWAGPQYEDFPISWLNLDTADASALSQSREFNKIVLKNGSQDRDSTFLITQSLYPLAREAGFAGVVKSEPCLVYLNGSFYSYMLLQPHLNRDYLGDLYGVDDDLLEWNQYTESSFRKSNGLNELIERDPQDPEARNELEALVDLDSLFLYYGFHLVCNNLDCILNNYGVWRYTGDPIPGMPWTDGRWRFLLYDLDRAYFFESDAFDRMLRPDGSIYSPLLSWIVRYEPWRDRLVTVVMNLVNESLSPDAVTGAMEREKAVLEADCENPQFGALIRQSLSGTSEEMYERVYQNAATRREQVIAKLRSHFSLPEGSYTLHLDAQGSGGVRIGNLTVPLGTPYEAEFLSGCNVTLEAAPAPDRRFSHWLVDGREIRDAVLTIPAGQTGTVNVTLVTEPIPEARLVLNEVSANGKQDWFELKNVGTKPLYLGNLYISNRADQTGRCRMPGLTMEPGELLVFNCKHHTSLIGCLVNFNLKQGEHICIFDAAGSLLYDFVIPGMAEGESAGLDPDCGLRVWYSERTPGEENPSFYTGPYTERQ